MSLRRRPTSRSHGIWPSATRAALISAFLLASAASTLAQGSTALVSRSSTGAQGNNSADVAVAISGDGRYVAFRSYASNLVLDDTNGEQDAFVHDRWTGRTTRASVSSAGVQANGESWVCNMTSDGRFIVFWSRATNLVDGDTNDLDDLFVHDQVTGVTSRVSISSTGSQGDAPSGGSASVSADGRYVAFDSHATNLVDGDTNGTGDVFLRDRVANTTTRLSVSTSGSECDGWSASSSITPDGRYVAFTSGGTNLVSGDANGCADVFLRDLVSGTTTLVSMSSSGVQNNGDTWCSSNAISADGRYVALWSASDNLVANDTNGHYDAFLRDRVAGTTTRVSVASDGAQGDGFTGNPSISPDGRFVLFVSSATNLAADDMNGRMDVFAHERATGTTRLISRSSTGAPADQESRSAAISEDGRYVAFESFASNLVPRDENGTVPDFFVRDTVGCSPTIATYCTAATTTHGCVPSIAGIGSPSASTHAGFAITVNGVEGQRAGLIFYGISGPRSSPFGGGASVLCVASPLQRTPVQSSGGTNGACDGHFTIDWNLFIATHPIGAGVPFQGGETVWAQAWFRDPSAPGGSNLSDGLWFDVCP